MKTGTALDGAEKKFKSTFESLSKSVIPKNCITYIFQKKKIYLLIRYI